MLQELLEPISKAQYLTVPPGLAHPDPELVSKSRYSDFVGMSGSVLCIIHCIAPQLIMLGSIGLGLGTFFASGIWHIAFWLTCLLAVWKSSRVSVFPGLKIVLWAAFLVFTFGISYEWLTGNEHWISYVGSLSLIAAHTINFLKQNQWRRVLASINS